MRALFTGASGFVGSGVLEYFMKNTDWDFTCLCSWRHQGAPSNIQPNRRIHVVTHDLVGPIPDLGTFDYILNFASESHVDRSIADPVDFIENNVSSVLQVLEYARKHPPKVLLHFSTDEVYGAVGSHEEWDVFLPGNPYAASKASQEMIAMAYWRTYGVPVVITNSNNIVGRGQNIEKFVPKLIDLIHHGQAVSIHTSNGKPGKRYYNSVHNVADALLFILDQPVPAYGEAQRLARYSLPGGEPLDNLEMAERIARLLGKGLRAEFVDAQTVRPGYDDFYPETRGALVELGWTPPFTLDDELRSMTDYL
jgi:dTDP-glucose 4,6-dehydratase